MGQRFSFSLRSRMNSSPFLVRRVRDIYFVLLKLQSHFRLRGEDVRRSFENSCLDRAYGTRESSAGNSLRKTIVLPVVRAKLWRQTGFEDIPELLFFAPVRLYLDEGIL